CRPTGTCSCTDIAFATSTSELMRERLALLHAACQRLGRRTHPGRIDTETSVELARPIHRPDRARADRLHRPLHLELEVLTGRGDLELVQLESDDVDVDLAPYFQHRYSRWSKKPGYEISTHSAPSISVLPSAMR